MQQRARCQPLGQLWGHDLIVWTHPRSQNGPATDTPESVREDRRPERRCRQSLCCLASMDAALSRPRSGFASRRLQIGFPLSAELAPYRVLLEEVIDADDSNSDIRINLAEANGSQPGWGFGVVPVPRERRRATRPNTAAQCPCDKLSSATARWPLSISRLTA
jgi:hypothetical protein